MFTNTAITQVIDYQKSLFDNSWSAAVELQDQSVQAVDSAIGSTPLVPEEGKKSFVGWVDFFKQNRESYKAYVDSSYDRLRDFFEGSVPPAASKTKKSSK